MRTDIDYYRVLQVDPGAEQEVIQAAYRKLAQKYHPDVSASPEAMRKMQELNEAYEILGNPSKRAEYDQKRTEMGSRRSQQSWNPTKKIYGKGKTSYEVSLAEDGFIDVRVCHENRHTRKFLADHKENPRALLKYRERFALSRTKAEEYLSQVMSDHLEFFERNRVRLIFC